MWSAMLLCIISLTAQRNACLEALLRVLAGIWVPLTTFLHVSFSNYCPSSLLSNKTCYMALPNKRTDQKKRNCKIQKILQIQKGFLSRGATGWMLHFNVRNTNGLPNNLSFGIGLKKVGHKFKEISTGLSISCGLLFRARKGRTCCWEGNWCYTHWNEASSLLHRGSNVLFFESARFFVSYKVNNFCHERFHSSLSELTHD